MAKLTIADLEFEADEKYEEGHTLTANEAAALDQLRRENLRNNFASTVKSLMEKGKAEGKSEADIHNDLRSRFSQYANDYEFNKRTAREASDPVEAEAFKMAREAVRAALVAQGHKLKDIGSDKIEEFTNQYLEVSGEHLREEAKRRIHVRQTTAAHILEGMKSQQAPAA